jgi:ATP-dependent Lhr-like helicase
VDQAQLRELIGDAELRELLDGDSMEAIERQLQHLDAPHRAKSADGVHDMLLAIGDLTEEELLARALTDEAADNIHALAAARRIVPVRVAGELRFIASEDAARYRDALGVELPPGIAEALLEEVRDPLGDLALRFARTHAPFAAADLAARYGLSASAAETVLVRLTGEGRLLEGEFRPGGTGREWTDPGVLRRLRRGSLAKLRHEVEPVDQAVLGRFATTWQGVIKRRHGADALLDVIEQLQGASMPSSILETEILPARIDNYDPADLDAVMAAGEIVWVGVDALGERDGRVALYLADHLTRLLPPRPVRRKPDTTGTVRPRAQTSTHGGDRLEPDCASAPRNREAAIAEYLETRGASFFGPLHEAAGGGYPGETVDALWNLAWRGVVTNDTFHALRAFTRARAPRRRARRAEAPAYRSRRLVPPAAEGRWGLVAQAIEPAKHDATRWAAAIAQQMLARHGVLTREAVAAESIPGGFGIVYPVLKAMEEAGRLRRGYFVVGLGATQFALPGALDLLRSLRDGVSEGVSEPGGRGDETLALAATDPANPYGATLRWPALAAGATPVRPGPSNLLLASAGRGPTRVVGATVILAEGALVAYLARGDRLLLTWLPESEPLRSKAARGIARVLIERARTFGGLSSAASAEERVDSPRGMLIEDIDEVAPARHPMAAFLLEAGFIAGAMGFQATFRNRDI